MKVNADERDRYTVEHYSLLALPPFDVTATD